MQRIEREHKIVGAMKRAGGADEKGAGLKECGACRGGGGGGGGKWKWDK